MDCYSLWPRNDVFILMILLAFFLLLTSCTQKKVAPPPIINTVPHFYFTVRGQIVSELIQKNRVVFLASYSTHNVSCMQNINSFEGAYKPYVMQRSFVIRPNLAGQFEQHIPLDYYERGWCDWQIDYVAYQFSLQETHVPITVATFLAGLPSRMKELPAEHWQCSPQHCANQGFFTVSENLPTQAQYRMNLFFEEKP